MGAESKDPEDFYCTKTASGSSTDALSLKQHLVFMPVPVRAGNPRADHRRHPVHCSLSCARQAGDYQYHLARSAAEKSCEEETADGRWSEKAGVSGRGADEASGNVADAVLG